MNKIYLKRILWKKKLIIPACVIVAMVLINQITVYPFVWTFRSAMGFVRQQGNPGGYGNVVAEVEEVDRVTVPVEGYPDAFFTIYRPESVQGDLPWGNTNEEELRGVLS